MRRVSPAFAERATAGRMQYRNPEYLRRATVFLRVAAGLDDPKTIEDHSLGNLRHGNRGANHDRTDQDCVSRLHQSGLSR